MNLTGNCGITADRKFFGFACYVMSVCRLWLLSFSGAILQSIDNYLRGVQLRHNQEMSAATVTVHSDRSADQSVI